MKDNALSFNSYFGSGSGFYSMAEDSLFFDELHKCTDNIFTYPGIIAELYSEDSTWFKGFNKKYFYDTGAFLYAWKPKIVHLLKWYYVIRLFKRTELSVPQIVEQLNRELKGIKIKKFIKNNCSIR